MAPLKKTNYIINIEKLFFKNLNFFLFCFKRWRGRCLESGLDDLVDRFNMREGRSEGGRTFLVVPQMFSMTNGRVLSCGHLSVAIFFLYISQILKKTTSKEGSKDAFYL